MSRIAVIGGGIAGLAAAHRLVELDSAVEVCVLEAGERPGGVIRTERKDGFLLEHGPESMIADKPWGIALVQRLGLESQLIGTRPEHRRSFVVCRGRLEPVPEGFQILAPARLDALARSPIFSWRGKLRMALDLALPPRRVPEGADESLGGFVLRRLGREALERLAEPMVAGIYGADPMELSLRATLPRFLEMERKHGSVIRGIRARARARSAEGNGVSGARYGLFVALRDGMETLVDALAARLGPERLRLRAAVQRLERAGGRWRLALAGGDAIDADAVLLALPAWRSAILLRDIDAELAALLDAIPYASAATLNLVYPRAAIRHPLDGFGFVVPRREGRTLLGCTFSHMKWEGRAPEGWALLRAFLGSASLARHTRDELERRVCDDLRSLLGIAAPPERAVWWQGDRCMPHYRVGHLERIEAIERRAAALPGLALAGNAFRGVGIPDCIHSGEAAAEQLLRG